MISATLRRQPSTDQGTFGLLTLGSQSWRSGELPWRGNAPDVSCVPPGTYTCKLQFSPHFQRDLYHLQDVPDRELCMIHPANWMGDVSKGFKCQLEGCIALGKVQGVSGGQQAVLESRQAIQEFMDALGGQDFLLVIS